MSKVACTKVLDMACLAKISVSTGYESSFVAPLTSMAVCHSESDRAKDCIG